MTPSLEKMLRDLPEHHLRRTVAERWDLKVPGDADGDRLVATMLESMRSPGRIAAVVDRLYGDLRRVLHHLVLVEGRGSSRQVADQVFDGDLWRTTQSLEELRNYQLVHLERTGDLQGAYPDYEVRVPADLQEPLREALRLDPVRREDLVRDAPDPVHRAGFAAVRDLVAILVLAGDDRIGRTREGRVRQRSLDAVEEVLGDVDPDRIDLLVTAAEELGLLVPAGKMHRTDRAAVDAFLEGGADRALGLILAGLVDAEVPETGGRVGELAWVLVALLDLPDGWLDLEAALAHLRQEGLRRDFQRWFARSTQEARAFVETVAHWLGLVDLGSPDGEAVRLTRFARALLGAEDPPRVEDPRVVVNPNLEVHLFQDPPDPRRLHTLLRFAEPVGLGPASRFRLTKEALWEGLAGDLDLEEVLDALGPETPDNVVSTLESWASHLHRVDLGRSWLLSAREPELLEDLLENPEIGGDLERIGPRHARVLDPRRVGRYLEEANLLQEAPRAPVGSGGSSGTRRSVTFDEPLDRLSEALELGLPEWLTGDAGFDGFYEPG